MISLVETLAVSLLLVAGLYVLGRASAAVGRRVAVTTSKTVRLCQVLHGIYVGVAVMGSLLIWGREATAGESLPLAGALAVNALATTLLALGGFAAVHRGLDPLPSSLGDGFTTRPRRWRVRLAVEGSAVFGLALVVQAYRFALVPGGVWLLAAGFVGVVFGRALVLSYWRHLAPVVSRPPTDGERARLEACFERFDGTCPPVEVTVRERIASPVFVGGHGPFRRLVVRESWLDGVTDDDLSVALSQTDAANRRWYTSHLLLYAFAVWSFYLVSLYALSGPFDLRAAGARPIAETEAIVGALSVLVLALLAIARRSKRIAYAADDETVDRFGPEAVVAAYERLGSDLVPFRNGELGRDQLSDAPCSGLADRLRSLKYRMRPAPSMAHRLERLRQSHDVDEAEPRAGGSSADETTDGPTDVDGDRAEAREETATSHSEEEGGEGSSRWWVAVAAPLVAIAGVFAASAAADGLYAVGVVAASPRESVIDALVPAFLLTSVLAPFGVYRERAGAGAGWRPSRAYYLTAVPLLNVLVAAVYVVRRRTVGSNA